jgi:hypothetical protein
MWLISILFDVAIARYWRREMGDIFHLRMQFSSLRPQSCVGGLTGLAQGEVTGVEVFTLLL